MKKKKKKKQQSGVCFFSLFTSSIFVSLACSFTEGAILDNVCLFLWITESPVAGRHGQEGTGEGGESETIDETPKQTSENNSAPTGFTVLGGFENKPVQKVQ